MRRWVRRQRGEPDCQEERAADLIREEEQVAALAAFHGLPDIARRSLAYWIEHVLEPSGCVESLSSRHLRRAFTSEAINVSEDHFKGSMLASGYTPVDSHQGHWRFRIQKKAGRRSYGLLQGHDSSWDRLIFAVDCHIDRHGLFYEGER